MGAPDGILVLGVPRSGTTLLRRLLDAHSRIACPGETHLFRACARFLESERGAEGMEIGVLAGLGHAGFPEHEVLESLRRLAFGFHEQHARRQGKARWAEKSAFDCFHVEAIERLCQDQVRYVVLLRHGLDVVCSLEEFTARSQGYLHELHVVTVPVLLGGGARLFEGLGSEFVDSYRVAETVAGPDTPNRS